MLFRSVSQSRYETEDVLVFATATKKFTYNYYPIKKETVTYDLNGLNPIATTISYKYNARNNILSEQTTISRSADYITTKYFYPYDLMSEPYMPNLVDNYLISAAVVKENYINDVLLSQSKTSYAKDATTNNLVLPKAEYSAKFPNALPSILYIGNLEKKVTSLHQPLSEHSYSPSWTRGYRPSYHRCEQPSHPYPQP